MKTNSPYNAAITGGGFLFEETNAILPLLLAPNSDELLADEKLNNRVLHINAETSRKKAILEIRRRFDAMPSAFWDSYQEMDEQEQRIALFYVILKTYKILFDFHVNVAMRRWNSISQTVTLDDLMMEFNQISCRDEFVDSWSDNTKKKIASAYLSILRHVGLLDKENNLHSVKTDNLDYYLGIGEPWFLEACLLQPYEIESIKQAAL